MAAEPFFNRSTADSLASIIDANSADDHEFHTQSTHVWVNGGDLEVEFDFDGDYDLTSFHLWNYTGENYDVDSVELTFLDSGGAVVSTASVIDPALGVRGEVGGAIYAEDHPVTANGVRTVLALISGTNSQVDFQNIGFTGTGSNGNIPAAAALLAPSGSSASGRPAYSWKADANASYYRLWVSDASGTPIRRWYTSAQANCATVAALAA